MRWTVVILMLCLSWTASQNPSEKERNRYNTLFGAPPTPTSGLNQTSGSAACETAEGKPGVCVQYYLCNPDTGEVITDGSGLLDVRIHDCPHYLQTCCLLDDVHEKPPTPKVPPQECGYTKVDDVLVWEGPNMGPRTLPNENAAKFAEFPWMVAVLKRSESIEWSQGDYLGGGSIIHPSVVMTAAHKVNGRQPAEVKCRGGEWDTRTEDEIQPHQERNVKKIVQHANFKNGPVHNSIALLILETPFDLDYAPHMGVACVMPQLPPEGTLCYSMGWGKEFFEKGAYAVILKKVKLPAIPNDKCQNTLRRTRLGNHFLLDPSLTCAGGRVGEDTCLGDGGAPLVCPIGNVAPGKEPTRFAIAGMVAWGLGCGSDNPGVYVNVPHLHDWLAQRMREEGFGSDSYTYST